LSSYGRLRKTECCEYSGSCTGSIGLFSSADSRFSRPGLDPLGGNGPPLACGGDSPSRDLLVHQANDEFLVSLAQAIPFHSLVPGRNWRRDDDGVGHNNFRIPQFALLDAGFYGSGCYPRSSMGMYGAGYSGPMYSARGRMSRLSSSCSIMCAAHPAMRLMAKMGV